MAPRSGGVLQLRARRAPRAAQYVSNRHITLVRVRYSLPVCRGKSAQFRTVAGKGGRARLVGVGERVEPAARTVQLSVQSEPRRLRPDSFPLYTEAPRSTRDPALLMLKRSRGLDGTAMSTASGTSPGLCADCALHMVLVTQRVPAPSARFARPVTPMT